MADTFLQEKSEAPTTRRREEFRRKGKIAHSPELSNALLLFGASLVVWTASRASGQQLLELLRSELTHSCRRDWTLHDVTILATSFSRQTVLLAASLVGNIVPMAVVFAICQSTFQVNFELLGPMWSKLSPAIGVGRLFSLQSMVQGIAFIGKQTLIVVVAAWFLMNLAGHAWCVSPTSLADTVAAGWRLGMWLLLCLSTAYLFVACVDYAWRWWNIEQELKMTRQELKEEHKQEDVDPQLKSRIRKLQREAVRRGMVSEIPRAAVVITNPTHLAIAIRYRRGEMSAPTVIAKGAGVFAKRIVKIARDNGIPVVERKSLARALFALVDVQQEIPPSLYRALAEILAYIYRLERR